MYDMSVPVYLRYDSLKIHNTIHQLTKNSSLEALIGVLKKGEDWAKENNVPVDNLVEARIHPDMNVCPYLSGSEEHN